MARNISFTQCMLKVPQMVEGVALDEERLGTRGDCEHKVDVVQRLVELLHADEAGGPEEQRLGVVRQHPDRAIEVGERALELRPVQLVLRLLHQHLDVRLVLEVDSGAAVHTVVADHGLADVGLTDGHRDLAVVVDVLLGSACVIEYDKIEFSTSMFYPAFSSCPSP